MGTAGGWHARRVKAGALRRHGGVSGPVVHYACPCGEWSRASPRGDSPRQAARGLQGGATGAPLRGSAGRGGEGRPVGWVALVGWAAVVASGAQTGGGNHAVGGLTSRRAESGLTSRQGGLARHGAEG